MTQPSLFDKPRKLRQVDRVRMVMELGEWWSLYEIQSAIRKHFGRMDSEAAISARLRGLRSQGYTIERRRRGKSATREYRMVAP